MPEPFLIAHLVRGEPAFDIATQIICPECSTINPATGRHAAPEGCDECDHTGYWWIIPTSGHRAYPYWYQLLGAFRDRVGRHADNWLTIGDPPFDWPDHYPTSASAEPAINLTQRLAIRPKAPTITRKI